MSETTKILESADSRIFISDLLWAIKKGAAQTDSTFLKCKGKSALAELRSAAGCLETVLLNVKGGKHLCINGLRY